MNSSLNIIAATNFSVIANNAAVYAAGLAKSSNAKLILFNSFTLSVYSSNSQITGDAMQKQLDVAPKRFKVFASELAEIYGIEVIHFCSYSILTDQLNSLINNYKADLVVMGMAKRSFEQDIIGNTTKSVIKNLNIPVLAVPLNAQFHKVKKILYACDRISLSSTRRFNWLREIFGSLESEIELFSVDEKLIEIKQAQGMASALVGSVIEEEFNQVKYVFKTVKSNDVNTKRNKKI